MTTAVHPLDMVTPDEIRLAVHGLGDLALRRFVQAHVRETPTRLFETRNRHG